MRRILELSIATILLVYFIAVGGTFNAILFPELQRFSLGLLAAVVVLWLIVRWRARWKVYQTPFDLVIVLWAVVFGASLIANLETWRRSAEALWFMLLYALVWYTLADGFANGMNRRLWLNGILIVGIVQVPLIVIQIVAYYAQGGTGLVRPFGSTTNPNLLGALCLVLLPLALANALDATSRAARRVAILFSGVVLAMLIVSTSRGAWIGAVAMGATFAALGLAYTRGVTSLAVARQRWQELTQAQQQRIRWGAALGLIGLLGFGAFLVVSFNVAGRGAEFRTGLWECAWRMFAEQPLVGQGLFTYGYHQGACQSIPPWQPHSHPHSLPLLILAEHGVLGGIATVLSLGAIGYAAAKQWPQLPKRLRWPFIGVMSALVGMGVQNIVDGTVTHPFMALLVIVLIAVAFVPAQPVPMQARWRRIGHPIGITVLWLGLLGVGVWQSAVISQYNAIMEAALRSDDPATGAQQLNEQIIPLDPFNEAYRRQHAYLLGLAAHRDLTFVDAALVAYEVVNVYEPYYAAGFVNHAALRWQAGQTEDALTLAERAAQIAPEWRLAQDLAAYYRGERSEPPPRREFIYGAARVNFQVMRLVIEQELLPQIDSVSQ